ncbi:MAG: hypothetical protein M1608_08655 [Candidatus Omnitrophica bacterium]|nr:hypothetical protein [Candidatus Omnitrophota bacterium]
MDPFRDQIRIESDLVYYGLAADSMVRGKNPVMNGLPVVENSIINKGGVLLNFFDLGYNGTFSYGISRSADDYQGVLDIKPCNVKVRFPYTLKYQNKYLTFGWRYRGNDVEPCNVYLWSSANGIDWTVENGGLPVLTKSSEPASIWFNIWNVAVAVDGSNNFHMIVECAPGGVDQKGVGLGYSTARMVDGKINFDPNRTQAHVINGGGNPYLYYSKKEDTLLAIHGIVHSSMNMFSSDYWWITASYLNRANHHWFTKPDKFSFGKSGIHVADPHAEEVIVDNRLCSRIIFSYNQRYIYSLFVEGGLDDLLRRIMN